MHDEIIENPVDYRIAEISFDAECKYILTFSCVDQQTFKQDLLAGSLLLGY